MSRLSIYVLGILASRALMRKTSAFFVVHRVLESKVTQFLTSYNLER